MEIKTIKKQTGRELIKDINQKYGSLDELQKYIKENPEDIIACLDFEDAKYLEKHPEKLDEPIETGKIWITWNIEDMEKLNPERLNLLDCIKTHSFGSIRELSEQIGMDYKKVYKELSALELLGLVKLERRKRNKIPLVNFDKLGIEV